MYARTAAIRDFGAAAGKLGADVGDAAAAVSKIPLRAVAGSFGPAGAQFAIALADATTSLTRDLGLLADSLSCDATAVAEAARTYQAADDVARTRMNLIGM